MGFFEKLAKGLNLGQSKQMEQMVNELEALGFYKHTDPRLIDELKEKSVKEDYLYWDEVERLYMSDAEDLAEGFIGEFFNTIAPFLEKEGVTIESYDQIDTGDIYEIVVNHRKFTIWNDENYYDIDHWEVATNRTFAVVNLLLQEAGSNERLYALYGGNDLFALFLTKDMYDMINKSKLIKETEKPLKHEECFDT